jgi:aspartate racemase
LHKTLGILGGVSPESTKIYYEHITREYFRRYGDFSYPEIIIYSVNFQEFMNLSHEEQWDLLAHKMVGIFEQLQRAGANVGLITANTLHIVFEEVQERSPIPLVSIIEATADAVHGERMKTVGLLGTLVTMRKDFYRKGLMTKGIETLVPDEKDQDFVSNVIYEELTRGIVRPASRDRFVHIVEELKARGAEGVVLGCTEIPLLIKEEDCDLRLFNTAIIHAEKALNIALG